MKGNDNQLRKLVKSIQIHTGLNTSDLASSINRSRQQLSDAMNGRANPAPLVELLQEKYSKLLQDVIVDGDDISGLIKQNLALSKVLIGSMAELMAHASGLPIEDVMRKLHQQVQQEIIRQD